MSEKIKVAVAGAAGRMGQTVCAAVLDDPALVLVGAVDRESVGKEVPGSGGVLIGPDLSGALSETGAEVLVDFTTAEAVPANAETAVAAGAHVVIGTTGLSAVGIDKLIELTATGNRNIILAPNFALGAVIMMKLCQRIAGYFDRAEIVELHHDQKHDAPSGTAVMTAELIAEKLRPGPLSEVEKYAGARGARIKDIPVHSVRLPGLVAHQEVIFGLKGQVLTVRHDSIDRSSFMPGVVMAVKAVGQRTGFTYGLDKLLDL